MNVGYGSRRQKCYNYLVQMLIRFYLLDSLNFSRKLLIFFYFLIEIYFYSFVYRHILGKKQSARVYIQRTPYRRTPYTFSFFTLKNHLNNTSHWDIARFILNNANKSFLNVHPDLYGIFTRKKFHGMQSAFSLFPFPKHTYGWILYVLVFIYMRVLCNVMYVFANRCRISIAMNSCRYKIVYNSKDWTNSAKTF